MMIKSRRLQAMSLLAVFVPSLLKFFSQEATLTPTLTRLRERVQW